MHLNIFVSQKCFLYCKGCYSVSREEECGKFVSTDKIVEFLKFAYDKGVRKVTLCGGDPLTRKDIIELLEQIKKIGFSISLDTVGTSIIKNFEINGQVIVKQTDAKKIAELVDVIGIPIDGSTNEIFKQFRQTTSDIINQQISVCEELHKFGANICINTVVHKGNLADSYELSKLIKKLDYINKWQMFQFAPLGKYGLRNRELFEISDEQFSKFKSDVLCVFDGDASKLQFKDSHTRNKAYMLIDNSGSAWIQSYENDSSEDNVNKINERTIIGNITNSGDWNKICTYLKKSI